VTCSAFNGNHRQTIPQQGILPTSEQDFFPNSSIVFLIFLLHTTASSSNLRKVVGMSPVIPPLAIGLIFGLASGCAPASGILARHTQSIQQLSPNQIPIVITKVEDNPALIAFIEEQDEQVQTPASPLPHEVSPPVQSNPPANNEFAIPPVETKTYQQLAKPHEKPVEQRPREPSVDDRLLSLLEKDLVKAVEQPVERRRLQFSKAVVEHPRVRYFVRDFSKNQKEFFARTLARSGKFFPMIARVLREEGLPEELAYLALIESNFHPQASSASGAVGLWQLIPETARRYGLKIDAWLDERRDPVKSTRAAAAYLKDLHNYFGRWYLTMAAYNAGEGTIDKALRASGATDFWSLNDKAKLRDETRNFVPRFVAASLIATDPKKFGLDNVFYETPLEYEEVEIAGNLPLASVAEMANADPQALQELNLELIKNRTPPGAVDFRVKIPAGHAAIFFIAYQQKQGTEHVEMVTHEVKKGETLFSIARRYGQEVRAVMELNGLTGYRLRIGQKLKVIFDGLRGGLR
jgi:soluble lytic murein transglycosylase-like protein